MRTLQTRSPANPEFARVIPVASLRRTPEYTFDIAPDPREAEAVAALLGAEVVRKLRLAGTLRPISDGWLLEARLGATVVQPCVVTLAPVTTRVDTEVRRRFVPTATPREIEIEIDSLDDDELEPLGDTIDLGLVAIEALSLALPEYPRAEGAVLPPAPEAEEEPRAKPFADLASLRDKLGGRG
jgi:uncharacterized metal-binding protein YceD (DUF177 family)